MSPSFQVSFATRSGHRLSFRMDERPLQPQGSVVVLKTDSIASQALTAWRAALRAQALHCFVLDLQPVIDDADAQRSADRTNRESDTKADTKAGKETDTKAGKETDAKADNDADKEAGQEAVLSGIEDFFARAADALGPYPTVLLGCGAAAFGGVRYLLRQEPERKNAARTDPPRKIAGPAAGRVSKNPSAGGNGPRIGKKAPISGVALCGVDPHRHTEAKIRLGNRLLVGPPEPATSTIVSWIQETLPSWLSALHARSDPEE
jgi:hypothetical protein